MAEATQLSWDQFNRFKISDVQGNGFYGVVTKDGEWVDSAMSYPAALILGAQYASGQSDMDMIRAMGHLQRGQVSIVHSPLLKQMYEAGLIK